MEPKAEHAQDYVDGEPGLIARKTAQKAIFKNSSAADTGSSRNTSMQTAQLNGEIHCTATMAAQTDNAMSNACLT